MALHRHGFHHLKQLSVPQRFLSSSSPECFYVRIAFCTECPGHSQATDPQRPPKQSLVLQGGGDEGPHVGTPFLPARPRGMPSLPRLTHHSTSSSHTSTQHTQASPSSWCWNLPAVRSLLGAGFPEESHGHCKPLTLYLHCCPNPVVHTLEIPPTNVWLGSSTALFRGYHSHSLQALSSCGVEAVSGTAEPASQ